uniref:Uncharacterized protein n=1 Tax=Lactuca sativa TaxID=4236 RepID=A0A9R1UNN6_LACSA|nr:hypothetical protein LSAT_V11C800442920 [Lactuca sativa]
MWTLIKRKHSYVDHLLVPLIIIRCLALTSVKKHSNPYPKSKKKMSNPSSSGSIAKKEELRDCQLPVRICTSNTKDSPNKKFKKPSKKCKYWEWIDEPVTGNPYLKQELEAVKEDVACLKKEVQELKNKAHSYRVEISCNII